MNESYPFVLHEYEEGNRQKAKQAMLDVRSKKPFPHFENGPLSKEIKR